MKISIEGDMNPCTFMGCSFEERAGFQDIIVKIKPTFKDAMEESVIEDWVKETEARCPVTDNIKDGTKILVENI
jgi:uncharacterized OsmC-like protein